MLGPTKLPRDIDALFEHLTGNLGHKLSDRRDWGFMLRGNYKKLESLAHTLKTYRIHLEESPQDYTSRRVNG